MTQEKVIMRKFKTNVIESKIFLMRGQKVMIDRDLADLCGGETKVLNQAV